MTGYDKQDILDAIAEDMDRLQGNISVIEDSWELKEPFLEFHRAPAKYPFQIGKRFARKLMKWFLKPYFEQQVDLNSAVYRGLMDIYRIQEGLSALLREQDMGGEAPEIMGPKVIQIVSTLNYGDAVGNDVIAIKNALKAANIPTEIYTLSVHRKIPAGTARSIRRMPVLKANDIVIYHFASADPLAEMIPGLACIKVLRYHNVTPPEFFHGFDKKAEQLTKQGLAQVKALKDSINLVMTDSDFNRKDLIKMGYQCPAFTVPVLIQFEDYAAKPSEKVMQCYSDDKKNIIFVGRVAPNKKIEDVIAVYDHYNKNMNGNSRLIIVGSYHEKDSYFQFLQTTMKKLDAKNVVFTGHIEFDEILGYYKIADAFLCMSEHEGFCVPLVEAMYFKVPIAAYESSAVPETLNGCGILLESKHPAEGAEALQKILGQTAVREELIAKEEVRLMEFDNKVVEKIMFHALGQITKEL